MAGHIGALLQKISIIGILSLGMAFVVFGYSTMRPLAQDWIETLSICTIDALARVIAVSGGNQQKVVIARTLVQAPRLVFLNVSG